MLGLASRMVPFENMGVGLCIMGKLNRSGGSKFCHHCSLWLVIAVVSIIMLASDPS